MAEELGLGGQQALPKELLVDGSGPGAALRGSVYHQGGRCEEAHHIPSILRESLKVDGELLRDLHQLGLHVGAPLAVVEITGVALRQEEGEHNNHQPA